MESRQVPLLEETKQLLYCSRSTWIAAKRAWRKAVDSMDSMDSNPSIGMEIPVATKYRDKFMNDMFNTEY